MFVNEDDFYTHTIFKKLGPIAQKGYIRIAVWEIISKEGNKIQVPQLLIFYRYF